MSMKVESSRSLLSSNSPFEKGLIPADQEVYALWAPEIGCWYTAPAAGRIGGQTVPAGARYRLLERGNPHRHSVWEVVAPCEPCLTCQHEAHRERTGVYPSAQARQHAILWGCTCDPQDAEDAQAWMDLVSQ